MNLTGCNVWVRPFNIFSTYGVGTSCLKSALSKAVPPKIGNVGDVRN